MENLTLTRNNEQSWIETIWLALDPILESMPEEQKDDVCTAMAWICEELNNSGFSIDDQY